MGTTVGKKDIATTGSGHRTVTPPATSMNPPVPPGPGPVPGPYPYSAGSATAKKTAKTLEASGDPVLVKGSVLDVDPPANQPSQPTGGDVVTHAVKGKVKMVEGSSNTKAGGKPVCATGDNTCVNVMTGNEEVAQERMPLMKAGGADMAGDKDGEGAHKDKKGKRAPPAQQAKKAGKSSGPEPAKCTESGHPVDVATGQVVDRAVDLTLPGAIPVVWKRSYSSGRSKEQGALGRGGWVHSFEQWVIVEENVITLRAGDGRDIYFQKVGPGESTFHRRERMTLTVERHGGFTIHEHDTRLSYTFALQERGGCAVLAAIRDNYGHAVTLEHKDENLVRIIDTVGREIRIKNDDRGRAVRIEVWTSASLPSRDQGMPAPDPQSPTLQQWFDYAYHPAGELAIATNALGHADRFEYDALHRMVKTTLRNGISFAYVYDEDTGVCTKTTGANDLHLVEVHFDRQAGTTTTSGTNETRCYFWNSDGLVLREETFGGDFASVRAYDADQYLLSESNAAGETVLFEYDARGHLTKRIDPAGNATTWEYDGDLPSKRIAPGTLVTQYRHDGRGALLEITYPSGLHYTFEHDNHGRVTAVGGADGHLVSFGYDAYQNVAWEESARGARTLYAYDALGQPIARTDGLGRTTRVTYDRLGQPIQVDFPDGTRTHAEYEPLGNIARFTDALGQVTRMEYAGTGVLTKLTQPDGHSFRFLYDGDERLTQIKNPRGEEYAFTYDRAGRIEQENTFDGRLLEYRV